MKTYEKEKKVVCNKQKGITLIALVITIVIMLILAVVTISIATNGNLFKYAKRAADEQQKTQYIDTINEAIVGARIKSFTGTEELQAISELREELEEKGFQTGILMDRLFVVDPDAKWVFEVTSDGTEYVGTLEEVQAYLLAMMHDCSRDGHVDNNNDGSCDECGTELFHRDTDGDGICENCYNTVGHIDENNDDRCDYCDQWMCGLGLINHVDTGTNGATARRWMVRLL